jgi:bifunctional DNA-binding transcriptional regulator/antitoxin component of YhaV-PrlF toxin-antitoxin module
MRFPSEAGTPTTHLRSRSTKPAKGGLIAIPEDFREALGIADDSVLQLTLTEDGGLLVRRVDDAELLQGSAWLRDLFEAFEPVRREVAASGLSDEEIVALIEEAVAEVRAKAPANDNASST